MSSDSTAAPTASAAGHMAPASDTTNTRVRVGRVFVATHFPVDVITTAIAIALLLINWRSMPEWEIVGYVVFIVLGVHQIEEYRFPGGFVWGLNTVMKSDTPDRFPGNALSAVFVDVSTSIVWGLLLFLWPTRGLVAFLVLFALMEVLGHLVFGISVFRRYRSVGKTTVYFPGNVTAFLGFAPVAAWGFYVFASQGLLAWWQWGIVVLANVAFAAIWMGVPSKLARNPNSPFTYPAPAAGYYLSRYEERLAASRTGTPASTD